MGISAPLFRGLARDPASLGKQLCDYFSVGMRGFAGSEYGPLLDFGFIVLCTLPQAMAVGLLLFNFPRKSPFKPLAYLMLLQGALFLGYSCVNSERETRYFSAILAIASLFTAFICFRSKKPLAYLMLLQGALFLWGSYGYWNVSEVRNFYAVLAIASLFTAFICFRSEKPLAYLMLLQGALFLWGSCVNSGEGRNIYAVFAIASLFTAFICFRSEQGSKWLSVSKLWLIPLLTFAVLLIMATLREVSMHASEKVFQAEAAKELKEQRKAFEEFRAAAAGGDADAQREMGRCYALGTGIAQDMVEAVKWYRKAAEQGDPEAQKDLGYCYASGEGVAKDHGEAVKWWRKAADQGNADAQRAMGRCYAKGFGVETDNIVALKWYRKAAQQGDREARNIADDLQKKIEAKPAEKKPGE